MRLSGGQKRLISLATSLAAAPRVLILDEPTNDLAPQNRIRVWDILRQINTEQGTTIILVTHNVLEAEKVIQRIGIMQAGKLIAVGRPGTLKAELNRQLRLEIVFTPGNPPALPADAEPYEVAPGRWQLLIEREAAAQYIDHLSRSTSVEDFRLGTATLEDLYLAMVKEEA
jgi:ABC-type multidrug transport system ATPase subunit